MHLTPRLRWPDAVMWLTACTDHLRRESTNAEPLRHLLRSLPIATPLPATSWLPPALHPPDAADAAACDGKMPRAWLAGAATSFTPIRQTRSDAKHATG